MSEEFVLYDKAGAVVTLTFNRPGRRNALATLADCEALAGAVARAAADSTVSCVILTGAGSAFCAGGDLRALQGDGLARMAQPVDTRANYRRGVHRAVRALWECELPLIAAVNGPAMGLGLDLACLCDIRLAAESARFASSFIKLGLVPGDGGAWILSRAVGASRAAELILTGDPIGAEEALAAGLVSRVVSDAALPEAARELAQRISANPGKTLRLSKRLLREGQQQRLDDVLELSAAFQALAHETADHAEALAAFLEKRPPRFTGR
jgi:enoyl-CoA hydratase/carnithine racemase